MKLSPYTHGIIAIEYTHSVRSIYAEASLSALSAARSVATSRLKSPPPAVPPPDNARVLLCVSAKVSGFNLCFVTSVPKLLH